MQLTLDGYPLFPDFALAKGHVKKIVFVLPLREGEKQSRYVLKFKYGDIVSPTTYSQIETLNIVQDEYGVTFSQSMDDLLTAPKKENKSELLDMTMYVCLPSLVLTIQKVLTLPSWWKMTNEEKKLLQKLASGELDGFVGNNVTTSGGSTVWKAIPAMFKQGPEGKFFNGQENERYEGVLHTLQKWVTDDEKLQFLQKLDGLCKTLM